MAGERDRQDRPSGEPLEPSALPPELVEFLRDIDVACLMQGTDQGTVFIIKLPTPEIESDRGTVPIDLRHELYAHPVAPVIRTIFRIYDQPKSHLALETFTNIQDEVQRNDWFFKSCRTTNQALPHQKALDEFSLFSANLTMSRFWRMAL